MSDSKTSRNKNHILKDMDKPLLIATIILIIFGTLSIVSASANESISHYGTSIYYYFYRHVFMLFVGFVGAFFIHRTPTKVYRLIIWILWIAVFSMIVILLIYGVAHRGSLNWLTIAGIKIQPSEFAKPVIIVGIAILFDYYALMQKSGKPMRPEKYTVIWIILGVIIPGIIVLEEDFGTAGIILFTSFAMYLAGPMDKQVRNKHILYLVIAGFLCVGGLLIGRGYIFTKEQKSRLLDFFDPCSKYEDTGYQICNCLIAINDGGLTGLGISKSKQKYSYIPEPYTDSIFSIVIEEDGLIVGTIVIIIYGFMIKRIVGIAKRATTVRGRYIAFGVAVYFFMHILFNLGGLTGILPLTGVPLPLITYGGSFTISFIMSLALVQRVNIETNRRQSRLEKVSQ